MILLFSMMVSESILTVNLTKRMFAYADQIRTKDYIDFGDKDEVSLIQLISKVYQS